MTVSYALPPFTEGLPGILLSGLYGAVVYDIVLAIGDQEPADRCCVRCGDSEVDIEEPQERLAGRGKRIRHGAGFAV